MVGLTAAVVFQQMILMANPPSYQTALQDAQAQQRPLLVLVGAAWCPGCQTMKQRVLPGLARRGVLKSVSFAAVDTDTEAEMARQLMRGGSIPQLIVFSRLPDGQWHREEIVGETSEAEVQSLIARALKVQAPAAKVAASAIGN
ncbi:MAG TPA: thioredoxin family protein [Pirellulaceae bacterium]|nr:thioredoxin family protein [Pirellulaceae bacterium]